MSDQRERQSHAVRRVRPNAEAGGWGLGVLPNERFGIVKTISRNIARQFYVLHFSDRTEVIGKAALPYSANAVDIIGKMV